MDFDSSDERQIRQFLQLAIDNAGRDQLAKALEPIAPKLREFLKAGCGQWRIPEREREDLAHDVFVSLLRHPPCDPSSVERPVPALLAWLKTTKTRKLLDRQRRLKRSPLGTTADEGSLASEDDAAPLADLPQTRKLDEQVALRDELRQFEAWVGQNYPAGRALLAARRDDPDATWTELARAIGISQANAHQIRKRLAEHFVRFREACASETQERTLS